MPLYEHQCTNCGHEWEEEYSIKDNPPETCPNCQENTVKRLISLGGKGKVELYGQDLVDKIKTDANQLKKDAARSEKIYSNLIGDSHYQNLQTKLDRKKR